MVQLPEAQRLFSLRFIFPLVCVVIMASSGGRAKTEMNRQQKKSTNTQS